MPDLYLVRHAEPEITGVMLGRSDPGLSSAGAEQASRIVLPPVALIYTSEMRRAKETGIAIARRNVRLIPDADLNEISYGDWDGRRWRDIEREYPNEAAAKLRDWFSVTPPGGEEWRDFAARVKRALARVRSGPLPAAIIAHITVHAQIVSSLSGGDPTGFTQQYGEVLRYDL
jgi:broad specificity phosphatase PhoE